MPKEIVVSDEVFQTLQLHRWPGETFSEVIRRGVRRGVTQREFYDVRTLTQEELEAILRSETSAATQAEMSN